MKCAMPASRAPGTSVSPIASSVSASRACSRRNGTPRARASRGVSKTCAPPTVNASAPSAAPRMNSRLPTMAASSRETARVHYTPAKFVYPSGMETRSIAPLALALALGACATAADVDKARASWQGASYEDVLRAWGAPTASTRTADGRDWYTWVTASYPQPGPSVGLGIGGVRIGGGGATGVGVGVGVPVG